ncbi:Fungalysin metallopeptidase-domain-containing protein [Obelidium mucronatum]|nr:Fungalysin metallopeptidase-domain-containing protein [Obelidium mucronatum]
MHSPRFFLALLAVASSMIPTVQAGPVQKAKPSLPGFYQPAASTVDVPPTQSFVATTLNASEAVSAATEFLVSSLKVDGNSLKVSNSVYSSDAKTYHIHYTETFHGLPIANANSNVNIDASGNILSIYQSFVPSGIKNSAVPVGKRDTPVIPLEQAVLNFAEAKGLKTTDKLTVSNKGANSFTVSGASFALSPIQASEKYYQTSSGLIHVWDISVEQKDVWQNAFINTENGEIVGVSNWTSDFKEGTASDATVQRRDASADSAQAPTLVARAANAVYNALPIGKRNPSQDQLVQISNPSNPNASPNGWHNARNDLSGNNVYVQSNPSSISNVNQLKNLPRPSNANLVFNYKFDAAKGTTDQQNRNAASTNLFYVNNAVHDIFYNYGFTEAAGNFQDDNYGKGGVGNDAVVATSQDGSGTNNADMTTPPDGQNGKMRMFLMTLSTPGRDGSLENDIVIHEYGHGLSNRLTGGPANSNCLQTTISGGMGEGWSDVVGFLLSMPATHNRNSDYTMGAWAFNRPNGIRQYPYSTSLTRNRHLLSDLKTLTEVHAVGEIWATALYEVLWNMVDTAGFTAPADFINSSNAGTGNTALLKLLIAAMKIQPCNPDMFQARNAIITADKQLNAGKFTCDIWKGFAKRGLGVSATSSYVDNFDIPAECKGVQTTKTTTTTTTTTGATKATTSGMTKTTTTTTTTTARPTTTVPSGGKSCYPEYLESLPYSNGSICGYQGNNYVLQGADWVATGACDASLTQKCFAPYSATKNYVTGNQVSYNGVDYIYNGSGWTSQGPCA